MTRRAFVALSILLCSTPASATSLGLSYLVPIEGEGGVGAMANFGFGVLPKLAVTAGAGYQQLGWATSDARARDEKTPWVDTGNLRADVGAEYTIWSSSFASLSVLGGVGLLVPISASLRNEAIADLDEVHGAQSVTSAAEPEVSLGLLGGAGLGVSLPIPKLALDLEGRYVRGATSTDYAYTLSAGEQAADQAASAELHFSGFEISLTGSF